MAEVHVFGQILSGSGFTGTRLSCKWKITFGSCWKAIEGSVEGVTQLDFPQTGDTSFFCHPIDVHFLTTGIQGWPRLEIEVWQQDPYRHTSPVAYGFVHIPPTPGKHQVDCLTWRPIGSQFEEVLSVFTGSGLRLEDTQIVSDSLERFKLQTESSGKIQLDLYVILRNFERFALESS